jgi:hypothetical protein
VALQPPIATVAVRRDSVTLSLDSVVTFEVSRGRESREATGAIVGAAAGLALGFVAGQIRHPTHDPTTREIVGVTLLGGFVGTGLGVAIGMQIRSDRWEVVPVPGRD